MRQVAHEVGLQPREVDLAAQDAHQHDARRGHAEGRECEDRPVERLPRPRPHLAVGGPLGDGDGVEREVDPAVLHGHARREHLPIGRSLALDDAEPEAPVALRAVRNEALGQHVESLPVEPDEQRLVRAVGDARQRDDREERSRAGEHARRRLEGRRVLGVLHGVVAEALQDLARAPKVGERLAQRVAFRGRERRDDAVDLPLRAREAGPLDGGTPVVQSRRLPGEEHRIRDGHGARRGRGRGVLRELERLPDRERVAVAVDVVREVLHVSTS